jgi:hypothetical protein
MSSAANKLANVLLRKEQAKSKKSAARKTYRRAFRTGMRRAYITGGATPEQLLAQFGQTRRLANSAQLEARNRTGYIGRGRYTGRGGFFSDAYGALKSGWQASSGLRGMLGNAARSGMFGATGVALGQASKALGTGAYVTNDLVNEGMGASESVPQFGATSDQSVILSHSEYIQDIVAPDTAGLFHNQILEINPGLFKTFPWLSQIAANYEEYELKQLIFTYKPTITDFVSTNGQVGSVIMATQYNVQDEPFSNKNDMMHYSGAMATKVSQGMLHGVECNPNKNSGSAGKYIRGGPVLPDQEKSNFDLGTLNIATHSTPLLFNSQTLGELWCSYTVELRKSKFYAAEGSSIVQDTFVLVPVPGGTGPIPGQLENLVTYPAQQNRIGGSVSAAADGTLTYMFPNTVSGTFRVRWTLYLNTGTSGSFEYSAGLSNFTHMFPVKDLLEARGSTTGWTWAFATNGPTGITGPPKELICEADVRVENPGGTGATNHILFQKSGTGIPSCFAIRCEVISYNNSFDYDGTKQLMLLDNTTGALATPVTTIWP